MKKKINKIKRFNTFLLCTICIFLQGFMLNNASAEESWKSAPGLILEDGQKPILSKILEENNEIIRVQYLVPEPTFETSEDQKKDGENTERCILGNANLVGNPGEPLIPAITSRIILPQGRAVKTIRIIPGEIVDVPGSHLLAFGEIPHRLSSKKVERINASDETYSSDNPFPLEPYELVSVQDRCGVSIAIIENYPLIYYPSTGKIEYYKTFTLEVETQPMERKTESNTIKARPDRILKGIQTEENPATLESYKDLGKSEIDDSREEYSYVVVTNKDIINATTSPNLTDFIAHKTGLGFTCKVEAIEDIKSNYPGSGDDDKLRNFLRYAYNNWNTQYVLLGGDTNIIPLRTVFDTDDDLPSDLPYQCLSQETWNNDYEAELFIGRASAENVDEFSNFVYKTIAYETSDPNAPYLKKVLSASEKLDNSTYGKESMDTIANLFSSDFSFDGIHDQNSTWPGASTIINSVNSNKYGIINHLGHSNTTYVMKLSSGSNWNPDSFTNTNFIFAKSQGCIPGAFDRDCIAEHMTTSNRAGMWGVVYNSRYGWYQPGNPTGGSSHKVHASFWSAYFDNDLKTVGQCNEYSHRLNTRYRWDILESNLLGDPSVIFGETTPSTGPTASFDLVYDTTNEYKVKFTENSDCSDCQIVEWKWNFGDSTTSDSENPEHIYTKDGTYTVELTVTSDKNETATFSKTVTVPQMVDYCESGSGNSTYFHISNVVVGSFSNSSGASNFTDFTSETITVNKDERYDMEIACGGETKYHNWYTLQIDLNRDGDFEDSDELLYDSGDAITGGASGTITIPASAITGTTRMRVTQKNGSQPGVCEQFTYGEVEDYSVSILGDANPVEASFTNEINNLDVAFTNTSTGDIASYDWDFGDRETSDEENPNHTYKDAGIYNVSLTVTGNDGSRDTATASITVTGGSDPNPLKASFTSAVNGLAVAFTDTSTGDIASYYWDFGDRETSDEESPNHTYKDAGTYNVSLTITGTDGSRDTATALVTVTGGSDPNPLKASFTSAVNGLAVAFTDTSTGDIASYYWDFGDRETSDEESPIHNYKDAGTYNVSLTITGTDGSRDTATAPVTVTGGSDPDPLKASFTNVINDLTVTFTNTSTGDIASYYWDFGDRETSDEENPNHTYKDAGTYNVSLTVTGKDGSQDTATAPVTVTTGSDPNPLKASFTTVIDGLVVAFTDTSTGDIVSSSWNFGERNKLTTFGPSYTYDKAGTYTVSLTVTGRDGSQDTATTPITVTDGSNPDPLKASFTSAVNGLAVAFTDTSTGDIASYYWDFGDRETSDEQSPNHTYKDAGTYNVSLTVTGRDGSQDTATAPVTVTGGSDPDPLKASFTSAVNGLAVAFTDTSTGDIASYYWDFGDRETSDEQSPNHTYKDAGTYNVSLTVTGKDGSQDTATAPVTVTGGSDPDPLKASFTSVVNGLAVAFTDTSTGDIASYYWDFGDRETSEEQSPNHTYKDAGTYNVSLTVTGRDGSQDTATAPVTVTGGSDPDPLKASFTSVVSGLAVGFTDTSTGDIASYYWDFGDRETSEEQSPEHTYKDGGTYNVSLTITGKDGSRDTATAPITVTGGSDPDPVTASFTSDITSLAVAFTDTSTGNIASYFWDFGDRETSESQSPNHTYKDAGTYNVSLTITGTDGSSDSANARLTVTGDNVEYCESKSNDISYFWINDVSVGSFSKPSDAQYYSDFTSDAVSVSKGKTYDLSIGCGGETKYHNWYTVRVDLNRDGDFEDNGEILYDSGDAITGGASGSITIPASAVTGTTRMRVTQKNGSLSDPCEEFTYGEVEDYTLKIGDGDPNEVEAFFNHTADKLNVAFTDSSSGTISRWAWNFGDSGTSGDQNPRHTYSTSGSYQVTLTVTGSNGETDDYTSAVTVSDGGGDNNEFIVTAVNDDLDNNDLFLMSNGLKSLGYTESISDTDVSSSELRQYLSQDIKALYHTGHGSNGSIMTSDGSVTSSGTVLNVENTMIATCLTLTDTSWKSSFSSRAQMFAGYTKVSYDGPDDDVVDNIIDHLGNDKSYPVSWYLSNNAVSSLSDRWCLYSREGSDIVEYSARTGNIPSTHQAGEMSNLGKDNKLFVLNTLLNKYDSVKTSFPKYSVDNMELKTSEKLNRFKRLNKTTLSKKNIRRIAKRYLRKQGEYSDDMKLDKITVIQKKKSDKARYKDVGYSVRYIKKAPNGMDIRGNGNDMHKTVMITGRGRVVSFSKNWMTLSKLSDADVVMSQLLSITDALNIAAADISRGIKSETLEIVDVEMVYGIASRRSSNSVDLVPAYGFKSSDGITIVVNAQTGDLIK